MSNNKKGTSFDKGVTSLIILVGGWIIAPNLFRLLKDNDINIWVSAIIAATIVTGIYKIGFSIRKDKIDDGQQERDELAHRIFEKIDEEEFTLYLRPFKTSGKLKCKMKLEYGNSFFERNFIDIKGIDQHNIILDDLETILAYTLENDSPLIALGHTDEYGAGKLSSSETWQNNLLELINYAKLIFIVPLDSISTKWEISNIVNNNLLYKCIFIMPSDLVDLNVQEEWTKSINEYSKLKLPLPTFSDNGLLFTYDSTFNINWSISLNKGMTKETLLSIISLKFSEVSKINNNHDLLNMVPFDSFGKTSSLAYINDYAEENDTLKTIEEPQFEITDSLDNIISCTAIQTKDDLTEKVGKKFFLSEDSTLAGKLVYVRGIQAFDQYLNGRTLKQLNAVIHLTKYPKGYVIKIAKIFSSFSFGLAYSEIKRNVITERQVISYLTFEMMNKTNIVFSLKTYHIAEIKSFLEPAAAAAPRIT